MSIKRVSDLEKYFYDESTGLELSAFLTSPEYLYSCIEVSQNKNGSEHSQFQSMRMDIGDLHTYMEYNVINNDILFKGNKRFENTVVMQNGADISGNFNIRKIGNENNTVSVDATNILLSSQIFSLSSANTTLNSSNLTQIRADNLQLSAAKNVQISASTGSLSCTAKNLIALDTPKTAGTVLSGKAERIIFDMAVTNDDKFVLKVNNDKIMWADKDDVFHFAHPIYAVALSARWADLAEYYIADKEYEPGTLVKFGGKYEITEAAEDEVNAVVTCKPGFLLHSGMEVSSYDQHPIAIALVGRTPVKVIGKVKKFQNLMLSDVPGIAVVSDGTRKTIGKALADKLDDTVGLVECAVMLQF